MRIFRRRRHAGATDAMGRPFGTLEQVEAEVKSGKAKRQARLDEVERRLAEPDVAEPERAELLAERKKLRTFFWLASGGDRRGEPPPD